MWQVLFLSFLVLFILVSSRALMSSSISYWYASLKIQQLFIESTSLARCLLQACYAQKLSTRTYILHLNNAIDKINKRCRCFHDIREAKISEDKNPRLTIDCCFDILAVWHFDGMPHAPLLLVELVWQIVCGRSKNRRNQLLQNYELIEVAKNDFKIDESQVDKRNNFYSILVECMLEKRL